MLVLGRIFGFRNIAVMVGCMVNIAHLTLLYDVLPSSTGSSWHHIPLAYNFYKYGTLSEIKEDIEYKTQKAIPAHIYEQPEKPTINDTVGYAFLVGALWKITGSLDLLDVQLLQIIMFCLMVFFLYEIFFLLFQNAAVAFIGCLLIDFWYHLILMNVTPSRDIWGYYGGVILAYVLLKLFLSKAYSYQKVFFGASFFAFCQFLRPNIVGQCATLCAAIFVLFYFYKKDAIKQCLRGIAIVVFANILFFWAPFIVFNKLVYDRYFVGPVGHGLLASLGTVENPWSLKCDDEKIIIHVRETQHINEEHGSAALNDAGVQEFLKLLKENPFVYIAAVWNSFQSALFFEAQAVMHFFYKCFHDSAFFTSKVQEAWGLGKGLFLLKILEHFSSKVLRNLGYIGLIILMFQRRFIPVIYLVGGVFLGMWILMFSHFEERYVIPFSWPFAAFAAYFLLFFWSWAKKKFCKSERSS